MARFGSFIFSITLATSITLLALNKMTVVSGSTYSGENKEKLPGYTFIDLFQSPPESRQKCTTVLGWMATKYPNNYIVMSLRNIVYYLALPHDRLPEGTEKELIAALDSLQGTISNVSGMEPGTYISVITCAIDSKGRNILQKIVEHGLVQALMHTMSQKFWTGAKLQDLVDTDNNNLAHLSAMSENDEMVHYLLGVMFKANIVADMLESVNKYGQKPIDIALLHKDQQTVDTMKNFFRVTTLSERELFPEGVEILEEVETLAEKEAKEKEKNNSELIQKDLQQEEMREIETQKRVEDSTAEEEKKLQLESIEKAEIENSILEKKLFESNKSNAVIRPLAISQLDELESDTSEPSDLITARKNEIQFENDQSARNEAVDNELASEISSVDMRGSSFSRQSVPKLNSQRRGENKEKDNIPDLEQELIELAPPTVEERPIAARLNLNTNSKPNSEDSKLLRGATGADEIEDEENRAGNMFIKNWSTTTKAIFGAAILVGISVLGATVVFVICKGYNKKNNSQATY
ncbi:hypothetical protein cand_031600 [Cryptosporidium andersoni]|uniref:Ankyrin repeat-containing protein n=1 Tax=Cryptosporidium andersoni TaxID=117008 RepID=A0A1J4MBT2_9CRYT|nr:hypothetical protein cand_031600 [Cryptosporidium andersoni]